MPIIGKRSLEPEKEEIKKTPSSGLDKTEAAFIASKLKDATYTGSEFETFYTVMTKLQSFIEKK